ncbi:trigger factor [Candidatus Saccharibacteria bacterium]|nr:trigger factor [Candidatus Saccharibacteria bacterium]
MKTTVKNISDTKVEVTIALDNNELEAARLVALKKLSKEVNVAGFRKGNAPVELVAKNVNQELLGQQTLEDALSKAVAEAFIAEDIKAIERPAVEVKKYVPGSELEFTAEAEIIPPVKLGDYKALKAKKEVASVTDGDVDEIITRLQDNMTVFEKVDREAQDGDEAVIDFVGKKDGEAFDGGTGNDYGLKLGSGQFIPGFEEQVVGKKAGEAFDIKVSFPDDYHVTELAGQPVVFETTLKEVRAAQRPELDDEFAAKSGPFTSVEELKADIKRELGEQKVREADEKLKDELVGELVEASEVPAPEVLVSEQEKSIEQDMTQNLMYQGATLDMYLSSKGFATKEEWLDKEVRPVAEKRVKAGLVLAELSKELKIEATNEELEAHIATYRQQYGKSKEALAQFDQPEVQREIANRLLTEKTVEKLVELND